MFKKLFSSVVILPLVAITVIAVPKNISEEGLLELDVLKENEIHGIFYPKENSSKWYIKFCVGIQDKDIVSESELFLAEEDRSTPFTKLKIPARDKHRRTVPHLREKILQAARDSYQLLNANETLMFPDIEELMGAYDNLANMLHRRVPLQYGQVNEVVFSIMYHSTIMGSVGRMIDGATEDDDICSTSPTYIYGKTLFVCSQEIERFAPKFISDDKIQAFTDKMMGYSKAAARPKRGWSFGLRFTFPQPRTGRDLGCCGSYDGPCWFSNILCYWHDRICICCFSWWFCFSGCRPARWC